MQFETMAPRLSGGGTMSLVRALALAAVALAMAAAPRPSAADPFRFAQFDPLVGQDQNGQPIYNLSYRDSGSGGKELVTTSYPSGARAVVPVAFEFTAFDSILPAALQGRLDATLDIDIDLAPGISGTTRLSQAITSGTITVRLDSPYLGQDLLLKAVFTGGEITGRPGATAGLSDVSVTAGDAITFSSDFLDFSQATTEGITLDLNPLFPSLQKFGANSFRDFRATGSGQFSLDGRVTLQSVPEPSSIALLGLAGALGGPVALARLRRRR
ncbi:PEP-CTERM sorting domain-containing protein [Tautonia plasticadhaerens]|uniref:Ice-binding protein C-terminal domain-containing protein n=1 Tax=Tautonia plasticadhaerens TaxID=2527974 RepID=A0A518HCV3_9BACT|nr:PEP-CTERM sorting domain-containing protein [Tautonia plasticadhaerens]QDV38698.1 hypothetical protein ElP_66530 [Tautonia plasticadhaerens]